MDKFPEIGTGTVNVEEVPEAAGYFMAFTAPVLLLYNNGKEILREARFVPMDSFAEKVRKIHEGFFSED
ncbi:thioredoxin family protein [Sediminibacillus massiliensis]|uniref:thioredoxin family protein n=1 Tax=Sediminibacillus massiliensis TaxID=1926277 RepID=UPI001FE9B89B|nr:thioredoxin family protein [Sediminibacillus massiliensis]